MLFRTIFFSFFVARTNAFLSSTSSPTFNSHHISNLDGKGSRIQILNNRNPNNYINHHEIETARSHFSTKLFSTSSTSKNKLKTANTNNGVTSTLISQLAVVALKLRLAQHSGVACDVTASSKNIFLNSSIGPVTVRGRGWGSPLGLTCRAIDATVDTCTLDMNSVIRRRKLILVTPAEGKAMVALNPKDFGSFLTHPLLVSQSPSLPETSASTSAGASPSQSQLQFEFSGDDVEICHESGVVIFYGNCAGEKWRCRLMRGSNGSQRAAIRVSRVSSSSPTVSTQKQLEGNANTNVNANFADTENQLNGMLEDFFNDLVFELDGTFLSFQDMKVHRPKDSEENNVLMALGITVKKFPSPGVAF